MKSIDVGTPFGYITIVLDDKQMRKDSKLGVSEDLSDELSDYLGEHGFIVKSHSDKMITKFNHSIESLREHIKILPDFIRGFQRGER
jgi:hypothetical protein